MGTIERLLPTFKPTERYEYQQEDSNVVRTVSLEDCGICDGNFSEETAHRCDVRRQTRSKALSLSILVGRSKSYFLLSSLQNVMNSNMRTLVQLSRSHYWRKRIRIVVFGTEHML